MRTIESTGKTIDEAIEKGLEELSLKREQVTMKTLEYPTNGFLGLIGQKDAKVELTVKDDVEEDAKKFLLKMFDAMDIPVTVHIEKKGETLEIDLEGPNMGLLIGRRGQTLDSIQYLLSLAINKDRDRYVKVYMDTENYRKKREETLQRLANKMADKAKKTHRPVYLEPMNPYERRIIHSTLQKFPGIQTYSEGEDPNRRVIIELKKE